jgi:hypothetical protein
MRPLPFVQFDPPQGFNANGTEFQQAFSWARGSLVRWFNGALVPVGGWQRREETVGNTPISALFPDPSLEEPLNCFSWVTAEGDAYFAVGTNLGLYIIDNEGTVVDATPATFSGTTKGGDVVNTGYGISLYGQESYGTERTQINQITDYIKGWHFTSWGGDLLATFAGNNNGIWSWSVGDTEAQPVPNAPAHARDICVTAQRILFSVGDASEIRLMQWSDSENREQWAPLITNQAGSQILAGKGVLVRCIPVDKDVVVIGEYDVHLVRYLGPPYIFGVAQIAEQISIAAPLSAVHVGGNIYWLGENTFFVYSGGRVSPLPCSVMEYFINHSNRSYESKIQGHVIPEFNEIWWHYASTESVGDHDSYIAYNYENNTWLMGSLFRAVGAANVQRGFPNMVSPDGLIYEHEIASRGPDGEVFAETGFFYHPTYQTQYLGRMYDDGQLRAFSTDPLLTHNQASPEVVFEAKDFPNGPSRFYGPYGLNYPSSTRVRGKYIKVRVTSGDAVPWKLSTFFLEQTALGSAR